MKTINLRGFINPLSEDEMKQVKGGKVDEPINGPSQPEEAGDPCDRSLVGASCKIKISTGEVAGNCALDLDTGKMKCVKN